MFTKPNSSANIPKSICIFTHNLLRLASVKKGSTVKVCSNVRWILERCYHKFSLLSSGPVFQTLGPIESTSLQHRCKQTRKVWASLSKNQADRKSRRATPKQPYLSPVVCRPVIACHLVIILHNPDKCSSVCVKIQRSVSSALNVYTVINILIAWANFFLSPHNTHGTELNICNT